MLKNQGILHWCCTLLAHLPADEFASAVTDLCPEFSDVEVPGKRLNVCKNGIPVALASGVGPGPLEGKAASAHLNQCGPFGCQSILFKEVPDSRDEAA